MPVADVPAGAVRIIMPSFATMAAPDSREPLGGGKHIPEPTP